MSDLTPEALTENIELELGLLSELRALLAEYEIKSDLREGLVSLAVHTAVPGVYVWVFISFNNRYFSWGRAVHQHPVHDIPGAARRVATHVHGLHLLGSGE